MAKVSMIERDKKRARLVKKYAAKREALLAVARDRNAKPEDIFKANQALEKLPKNAMPSRKRNRCALTGRPRGNYRYFGICRIKIIEAARAGELHGILSSSW